MGNIRGKVLVLDEDRQSSGETRELLDAVGYEVCVCQSANEILTTLRTCQPGCLLINLCVPAEVEGKPLLLEIRECFPDLVIIAYTNTTEFNKHDLLKAGIRFIVQKSLPLNSFLNTFERALNEQPDQLKKTG